MYKCQVIEPTISSVETIDSNLKLNFQKSNDNGKECSLDKNDLISINLNEKTKTNTEENTKKSKALDKENCRNNVGNLNSLKLSKIQKNSNGFYNKSYIYHTKKSFNYNSKIQIFNKNLIFKKILELEKNSIINIGRCKEHMEKLNSKKNPDQKNSITHFEIQDSNLSRYHCSILNENNYLKIFDSGSLNGTFKILNSCDCVILNENLTFIFLNKFFNIEGIYTDNVIEDETFFINFLIGNSKDKPTSVLINSKECGKPFFMFPCSKNKQLNRIITEACQLLKFPNEKFQKKKLFPYLTFKNKHFYIHPQVESNHLCEILLKLDKRGINHDEYRIELNINDKFLLGGDILLTLKDTLPEISEDHENQELIEKIGDQLECDIKELTCVPNGEIFDEKILLDEKKDNKNQKTKETHNFQI